MMIKQAASTEQYLAALSRLGQKPVVRIAGAIVGVGLLVAALIVAWNQRPLVAHAIDAAGNDAWGWVSLLCVCVLANIMLAGVLMQRLNNRHGKIGFWEMQAVIAAATLVNFLPLRPGLFARVAYHARYNDMQVRHAGLAVVQAIVLSLLVSSWLVGGALVCRTTGLPIWIWLAIGAAFPLATAVKPTWRFWSLCMVIRYAELLIWALRVFIAFRLTDNAIGFEAAAVFSAVISIASMVPFVSNGLGLREWAVALMAPLVADLSLEVGLIAELVNRAAEIVVVVVVGLPAVYWLVRLRKSQRNIDSQ